MTQFDLPQTLIAITELAVALAGFTGVVVALSSKNKGGWIPADQLRLGFLLEAALTAAGFALLALVLLHLFPEAASVAWTTVSALWTLFMIRSLYSSHHRIRENRAKHGDIDHFADRLVLGLFSLLILIQIVNVFYWREFAPLLAALCLNLAGAAMQFARLVRAAFRD